MNCFVYIAECSDGTYYTGMTSTCVTKRIRAHNNGRGAKYTRSRLPVRLIWFTSVESKGRALSVEYRIKKLTRRQKEDIINDKVLYSDIIKESRRA